MCQCMKKIANSRPLLGIVFGMILAGVGATAGAILTKYWIITFTLLPPFNLRVVTNYGLFESCFYVDLDPPEEPKCSQDTSGSLGLVPYITMGGAGAGVLALFFFMPFVFHARSRKCTLAFLIIFCLAGAGADATAVAFVLTGEHIPVFHGLPLFSSSSEVGWSVWLVCGATGIFFLAAMVSFIFIIKARMPDYTPD